MDRGGRWRYLGPPRSFEEAAEARWRDLERVGEGGTYGRDSSREVLMDESSGEEDELMPEAFAAPAIRRARVSFEKMSSSSMRVADFLRRHRRE